MVKMVIMAVRVIMVVMVIMVAIVLMVTKGIIAKMFNMVTMSSWSSSW